MAKTKYKGVYTEEGDQFYYETELGIDKMTGKRIRKKGRTDIYGQKFVSAHHAYKELTRIKSEYHSAKGYSNYNMNYGQFMDDVYIPTYETEVDETTFEARQPVLRILKSRFANIQLRSITLEDVQMFRIWLLSKKGAGYSQAYASSIFGMFRKTLDFAVEMNYLEYNISHKAKAIPKGKAEIAYWTKSEFEQVISAIYIDDFYEHMCFVAIWLYYMTGVRVNEGTALWWNDIDFEKKRLRVHHMLVMKTKQIWKRRNYTKTESGKRMIALDDDTLQILKVWKERQEQMGIKNSFVISYDGTPVHKSNIAKILERYSRLAGVHKVQGKGLRHSHASYLINEFNVSVLILSKRLGHSSPEITLKYYAHMWSGIDEVIAHEMTGSINIKTSPKALFSFTGNQAVKKKSPPKSPPSKSGMLESIGA